MSHYNRPQINENNIGKVMIGNTTWYSMVDITREMGLLDRVAGRGEKTSWNFFQHHVMIEGLDFIKCTKEGKRSEAGAHQKGQYYASDAGRAKLEAYIIVKLHGNNYAYNIERCEWEWLATDLWFAKPWIQQ